MITTDPVALRMMAEAGRMPGTNADLFGPASAPVPPPQKIMLPIVMLPRRYFGESMYIWLAHQLMTPRRLIRMCLWCLYLPMRAGAMLRVVVGGRESRLEYLDRMSACLSCSDRVIRLKVRGRRIIEKLYCGRCGCPPWYLSRLDIKNRFCKWRCPKRLHAGLYGDEILRDWLKEHGYDVDRTMSGGCHGCGHRNTRA